MADTLDHRRTARTTGSGTGPKPRTEAGTGGRATTAGTGAAARLKRGARGRRTRRNRRGGSLSPAVFFGAAGALTVIMVALLAVLLLSGGGSTTAGTAAAVVGTPAASGNVAQSYSSAASTPTFAKIATRAADKAPLTLDEVFPQAAQTLNDPVTHATLRLQAKQLDSDCAHAVWGAPVGNVLRRGGCDQTVRALYGDQATGYTAALTIFNLASANAANSLVATFAPSHATPGFLVPLNAAAPFDRFAARGFSTARGVAMGHFAVLAWVARTDGKGDDLDEGLMSLLVTVGQPGAVYARSAA